MALSNSPSPRPGVFGRRLSPPLTADQNTAAETAAREVELHAIRARTKAYLEARWDEDRVKFRACIRNAEGAIARRRVGAMSSNLLQAMVGFTIGARLGR
jgi:hypothetical protein